MMNGSESGKTKSSLPVERTKKIVGYSLFPLGIESSVVFKANCKIYRETSFMYGKAVSVDFL